MLTLRELTALVGIKQIFTSPFHPQTNGLVKRFNGTLAQTISFFVYKDHRDDIIKPALFPYRSVPSATTQESPFFCCMVAIPDFLVM